MSYKNISYNILQILEKVITAHNNYCMFFLLKAQMNYSDIELHNVINIKKYMKSVRVIKSTAL